MNSRPASCASTIAIVTSVLRVRSSLSRWRLATRSSAPASIRSTSTWVSVFQNARVVFGRTRCLGSPSNDTMATSLAPVCTIAKFASATPACVFSISSALSAAISRAHDLDHLGLQPAARIERREAAGAEQPLEAAVARQERALVVLDDHLEHQRGHDTDLQYLSSILLAQSVTKLPGHTLLGLPARSSQVAGCVPRPFHGPALEPVGVAFGAGCGRARTRGSGHAGARPSGVADGRYPRGRKRPDAAAPTSISAGASIVSWKSREAAGFPC